MRAGTITADIGRRVAPGRVLGIDASADVIEQARRGAGGGPNVEFSVGDLYALDTHDDTFDVVHAHQVLQHLADPVGAHVTRRRSSALNSVLNMPVASIGKADGFDVYRRSANQMVSP